MSELQILSQPLPGIYLLKCPRFTDNRGEFLKIFNSHNLLDHGISFTPEETYLTRSRAGVLRGMHFQSGESAHDKLVTCVKGKVLDVVVDVRPNSPYFNQPFAIELSALDNTSVLISKGFAHGFYTFEDDSWMLYSTTTVHNPSLDVGVLWSSIPFIWPNNQPIVSERDCQHPNIQDLI